MERDVGTWLSDLTFLHECLKKEKGDPGRVQQVLEREAQVCWHHLFIYGFGKWGF